MKRIASALTAATLVVACASAPKQDSAASALKGSSGATHYNESNVFTVGAIPDAVLHDAERHKDLPLTIEYPTHGGPFPVIIFSHGYGASKDAYTALTESWTSRGYICIKPNHADAGRLRAILAQRLEARRAAREKERAEGHRDTRQRGQQSPQPDEQPGESLWTSMTGEELAARARDITLIIDSLGALEGTYPELAGKMQKDHIAVVGHSLGAYTTMLIAGMTSFKTTPPTHVPDPRVKAAIAMSPQGIGTDVGLTDASWRGVTIPMLFMTGSLDRGLGAEGDPKWRHDPFAYSPAGDKYFVSLANVRHSTFAGGGLELDDLDMPRPTDTTMPPAGPRIPNTYQPPQQMTDRPDRLPGQFMSDRAALGEIRTISTMFLDAYLKNETVARDFLKPGGTLDLMNGSGNVVERK